MWTSVEQDLAKILSSRVFHTLANVQAYVTLFRRAGYLGKLPADLTAAPAHVRDSLDSAAAMCAQLIRMELQRAASLRERRAKAVVLQGPSPLYRLWSEKQDNRIGSWWFSQNLLHQALAASGGKREKALLWLRDRLAISLDMNDCDRLAELKLGGRSALPAIQAWGLPMTQYTAAARADLTITRQQYYSKRSKEFRGEKTQYYLPFVPVSRVRKLW